MAGYREFQTGEVLTAANVNNFLMEQATMTFADAAARDAALAGVLREGLLTYNLDEGRLEVYDGTDWVEPAPPAPPQNLVAVKSAIFTGTQVESVTGGNNVTVTDLEITHALADAGNKLIISAFFGAAGNSIGGGNVGIAVHDGTALIGVGATAGSRVSVGAGGYTAAGTSTSVTAAPSVTFVHAPQDVASRTFTVRAINIRSTTQTVFINRQQADGDSGENVRSVSAFVIQEVKV